MWLALKIWDILLWFSLVHEIPEGEYANMPTLFEYDDYENCMLYSPKALYCSFTFQLYPTNPNNVSDVWKLIQKVSSIPDHYKHDQLRHGMCVHLTCPNTKISYYSENISRFIHDLEKCYNPKYKDKGLKGNITKIRCEAEESQYPISDFDIYFALFLAIYVSCVLLAWLYDICFSPDFKNPDFRQTFFGKFVSTFSLSQNWHRLNHINYEDPDIKALSSIQGIRFFLMVAVITGHCALVYVALPVLNPRFVEMDPQRLVSKWVTSGSRHLILQTFFLLSSWLMTYQFFKDNEGKKRIEFSYFVKTFFKRYFRLTPTLAIMVGIYSTWMPHLGKGPFWYNVVGKEYWLCRKNWWSNLIYLNNLIHSDTMCSPHHWYMAVDMQYYVLGLFILWLIWNHPKKIGLILGSLWIFHVVDTYFRSYNSQMMFEIYPEMFYDFNLFNLTMTQAVTKAPSTNLSGMIAGIAYGYIFYKCRNKKIFAKKVHVVFWWITSLGTMFFIILFPGFFYYFDFFAKNKLIPISLYAALSRSIYIFSVGLWIFGMTQGHGHIIKTINEWRPMYVLGRLTYSAFLVHTTIQRLKVGSKRTPNYLNDYVALSEMIGDLASTYLVALLFTLAFEYPIAEIRKHIVNAYKNCLKQQSGKKSE